MSKRYTLLTVYPESLDATSFYRGARPLGKLNEYVHSSYVITKTAQDWDVLSCCDAVYLQRPFANEHRLLVELAKKMHVPVWADWDDDLLTVPVCNPAWATYQRADIRANVMSICQQADIVTTTTQWLADKFPNDNVKVVPNGFDDYLFRRAEKIKPNRTIFWRGTDSHNRDLMSVAEQVINVSKEDRDWHWLFMGYNPWFITTNLPQNRAHLAPYLNIIKYFEFIQEQKPAITIVPLFKDDFNQAKSNIAWIEATLAGSAVLAPNWPEWQHPGITNYDDQKDFQEKLTDMVKNFDTKYKDCSEQSWQYILENLRLSELNKKRAEILETLVKR